MSVIAVDPLWCSNRRGPASSAQRTCTKASRKPPSSPGLINGQGADAVIITTGEHIGQGFAEIREGDTVVVTGLRPLSGVGLPIGPAELTLNQKRPPGAWFGACSPSADILRQLDM